MALTYQEDLTQRFVENFSESIVCHFPDGYFNGALDLGSCYMDMSVFSQVPSQPTDNYFMKMTISESFTFNDSILDGVTKNKRVLVFLDFSIFWPIEKSKKLLTETIEPALDALFVNYKYRGTDLSDVYSQQDAPKDVVRIVRATGDNKWNEKTIRYPFVVRYI